MYDFYIRATLRAVWGFPWEDKRNALGDVMSLKISHLRSDSVVSFNLTGNLYQAPRRMFTIVNRRITTYV